MTKHEFFVDMTCEGCSGAVTRVLNKLDVKFDIDLPNKKRFPLSWIKQVTAADMKECWTEPPSTAQFEKWLSHHAEQPADL
ncbi:hypothetical protein MATL_G00171420 [Megalops atlanticus]|uniref:Copper transport protein ATOX1 n=1 Tax=Megalops atlanticus TaxID=7932 RepID=A0A9D3T1F3_MEGAT|nr:hypothetical protein MATL_G00171420 [Megalops atlanticus]